MGRTGLSPEETGGEPETGAFDAEAADWCEPEGPEEVRNDRLVGPAEDSGPTLDHSTRKGESERE